MKAAVLYEHGDRDRIILEEDFPTPHARPGWVVLRVRACSLNYHDIFTRRGMPGIRIPFPLIVGSDLAGEIAELGEGVAGWSEQDRVLVDPLPCQETEWKFVGEQFNGGRAEYCEVHSSQLMPIPAEVAFETAASIPLAYATAQRMMVTHGQVRAGETVLILGASGGVGTACVLIAKMLGARVLACSSSEQKLERLRDLGADHVIDYTRQRTREAVWGIVGKPRVKATGGVDLVVNYTGGKTWQESIRCLKVGGRLLTCGATAGFEEEIDVRYIWTFEHKLLGSNGWRRSDIQVLLDYARDGRLLPVIDKVFPLEEIHEAERLLEEREVFGKVVVQPGK